MPLLDLIRCDVHYALRVLRRSPAFTAAAIVALALAIALSGIALAGVGAAAGLGAAWVGARMLDSRSILWGVESHDAATFAGAAVFLLAVASIASVVPALRILRLDPAAALRA